MHTALPVPAPSLTPRLHPLLATAALAVTAVSLAGLASLSGWLPMKAATLSETAVSPLSTFSAPANAVPPAPTFAPVATSPQDLAPQVIEKIVYVEKPAPVPARVATTRVASTRVATPRVATARPAQAVAIDTDDPALLPVAQTLPPPPAGNPPLPPGVAVTVATPVTAPAPMCGNCGAIESIREIAQPGSASGLGAVLGGVAGGLLGSQIGGGNGKKLAAVLGAAGGAFAGHQVEKSRNETKRYEITVRMEDGTLRSVSEDTVPVWRSGERVRIDNGRLVEHHLVPSSSTTAAPAAAPTSAPAPLFSGNYDRI